MWDNVAVVDVHDDDVVVIVVVVDHKKLPFKFCPMGSVTEEILLLLFLLVLLLIFSVGTKLWLGTWCSNLAEQNAYRNYRLELQSYMNNLSPIFPSHHIQYLSSTLVRTASEG